MKSINASEFKVKCLQWIKEVAKTGVSVVITKNGQPVAQLDPIMPRWRHSREPTKARLRSWETY